MPTGCNPGVAKILCSGVVRPLPSGDTVVRCRPQTARSEISSQTDCPFDMKFFRTSPKPKLPDFHPDTVIRDFGDGDAFRLGDAYCGVVCFGATGSGKTSGPGCAIAHGFLAAGMGGLVLCSKRDECPQWVKWATNCGRQDDLVIVNAEGDWRYNFMDDEASRPGEGGGFVINIVALLDEIAGAIGGGKGDGGGDNKIWEDALHTLNSHAVALPVLAGLKVSLPLLRDITSSAAQTLEQVNDPEWQKTSVCWQILQEADEATKDGDPEVRADFDECRKYWTLDFPSYSDKTRSSILLGFTVLIHPLVTRPLRKLFSSDTNIRPEDTFDGKIIIVDLPTQEFRLAGRIANLIWKYCFQCAVLRRVQPADRKSFLRSVFLWADEAQFFITKGDAEYQAVARSAGGVTVLLTQNRESLRRVLKNDDAVDSLLANLQTKFFAQNTGATNYWASGILGEHYVNVTSVNAGQSGQTQLPLVPNQQPSQSAGVTRSQDKRYFVEPAEFTTLLRGGPQFNFQVEVICYMGGHLFGNGGEQRLPYKRIIFNQAKI